MPRKPNPSVFYVQDFPEELIKTEIKPGVFHTTLEIYNLFRRKRQTYRHKPLDASKEKLYRLYHYMGMDIPDRMEVHNAVLDMNRYYFGSVTGGVIGGFIVYMMMNNVMKYAAR